MSMFRWGRVAAFIIAVPLPFAVPATAGAADLSPVRVAVIDTGVAQGALPSDPVERWACSSTGCTPERGAGFTSPHGTQVAGVIGGVAPDVDLVSYRVTYRDGAVNEKAVYRAVEAAVEAGIPVVNMSVVLFHNSRRLDRLIHDSPGTLFVAAAGNQGMRLSAEFPVFPCMSDAVNVMCVGVSDRGVRNPSSNFGRPFVDLSAPGDDVATFSPQGPVRASGTSMAAAWVSAAAAQLVQDSARWSPATVKSQMMATTS